MRLNLRYCLYMPFVSGQNHAYFAGRRTGFQLWMSRLIIHTPSILLLSRMADTHRQVTDHSWLPTSDVCSLAQSYDTLRQWQASGNTIISKTAIVCKNLGLVLWQKRELEGFEIRVTAKSCWEHYINMLDHGFWHNAPSILLRMAGLQTSDAVPCLRYMLHKRVQLLSHA